MGSNGEKGCPPAEPVTGHARPFDTPLTSARTSSRIRDCANHPSFVERSIEGGRRLAISRTVPARNRRGDYGELGRVGKQPQSEILQYYETRPKTPGRAGRNLESTLRSRRPGSREV